MARASRRSESIAFQFRKRVPADIVALMGGPREVKISLGTADAAEAKRRFRQLEEEHEARWAQVRLGIQDLDDRQVAALAGEVYREAIRKAGNDRDGRTLQAWYTLKSKSEEFDHHEDAMVEDHVLWELDQLHGDRIEEVLNRRGMRLTNGTRERILKAVHRDMKRAFDVISRQARGDWSPDPNLRRFPDLELVQVQDRPNARTQEPSCPKLTVLDLFARWEQHPEQAEQARRTVSRYKGVLTALAKFLMNPDAREITLEDVRRYLEARMADEGPGRLKPIAARDVHKAAISSVFGWGVGKAIVKANPAEGVKIKVIKGKKLRPKEARAEEVRALAEAAIAVSREARAGTMESAKRWCTLIAMYTGCRIGEACQLRRSDLLVEDGLPMLRVTPEAGDVKDREMRRMPVHPRLVELGFLEFVESAPEGPLFYGNRQSRKAEATCRQYELVAADLATWARSNGLGDPLLLKPLHALRHRFATLARLADIDGQYMMAIMGHEPGDQSGAYGEFPALLLHREIKKLTSESVEGRKRVETPHGKP